jgi:hypothetical protein
MAGENNAMFKKGFGKPDERREFKGHGYLEVLKFEDGTVVGRGVFEPGWRWSTDVQPIAETESCRAAHTGFCLKGSMVIRMDGGEEFRVTAGEAFRIPAGHDAWVDGGETCELLDFSGFKEYAVPKRTGEKAA